MVLTSTKSREKNAKFLPHNIYHTTKQVMSTLPPDIKIKQRLSAPERRQALLHAATEVFLEKGYEATTLDEIIRRTGGSRRSIYTQFGSKQGLFQALVVDVAVRIQDSARREFSARGKLRERLIRLADGLLAILYTPEVVGIGRLAVSEGARFPELAKAYYDSGPGKGADFVAAMLEQAVASGEIHCPDCLMAANVFIGMLRDNGLYLQVMLQLRPAPDEGERKRFVHSAVDLFLNGLYGA